MAQVKGCKIEAKDNLEQATVWEPDELDKVAQIKLEKRSISTLLAEAVCC